MIRDKKKTEIPPRKIRIGWLILAVLLLAGGIWLIRRFTSAPGAAVVVTVDGEEVGRFSLSASEDQEIATQYGTNRLVIQNGKAKVTEADCPDKLCVHQKAISRRGESIICLPHKLTVTVEGGKKAELDGVAQ